MLQFSVFISRFIHNKFRVSNSVWFSLSRQIAKALWIFPIIANNNIYSETPLVFSLDHYYLNQVFFCMAYSCKNHFSKKYFDVIKLSDFITSTVLKLLVYSGFWPDYQCLWRVDCSLQGLCEGDNLRKTFSASRGSSLSAHRDIFGSAPLFDSVGFFGYLSCQL